MSPVIDPDQLNYRNPHSWVPNVKVTAGTVGGLTVAQLVDRLLDAVGFVPPESAGEMSLGVLIAGLIAYFVPERRR